MNETTKSFVLITVISTLTMIGGYFLAPIEVRFLKSFTENTTLIGLTYSVGAIFFALLSIYIGRLSATYGKKRFITMGTIAGIFYPLLFANTINIFQYMGVKFVWAFAGASTGPLLAAYLQDTISKTKNKGTLLGVFHSVHAIAGSMGALLGGLISDAYGFRNAYISAGYILVLPCILAIIFIGFKDHEKKPKIKEKRSILFSLKYVLSNPVLVFHLMLNTVFGLNWSVKAILYPLIIYEAAKSDAVTGSVFAVMGVTAAFVLPYAGRFIDKKGYLKGAFVAYIVLGFASIGLALSTQVWMFFLFSAFVAVGEAFNGPVRGVIEIDNIENKFRGEIIGFYTAWESTIGALSPLFVGILLGFIGAKSVLFIYSVVILAGFLVALRVLKSKCKIN